MKSLSRALPYYTKRLNGLDKSALGFVLAFLYLPVLVLVAYSFHASTLMSGWNGFSLQWYEKLFNNQLLKESVYVSLKIAFFSATGATILGTAIAFVLVRMPRMKGNRLFLSLSLAPLILPEIITGFSLLLLFIALDFERGSLTVILAHMAFTTAFVTMVVQSRLKGFDRSLEEASYDLGAGVWQTFWRVTLPIIAPAVAAGWLLAFTLSLDDLVIASFTSGPGATTLTMRIYSALRLGLTPEINALSTVVIVFVGVLVVLATLLMRRNAAK